MRCDLAEIAEGSESRLVVQLKDELGLPIDTITADSILFTLHDRQGNIINGRDQVEVLGEEGGEFVGEYQIAGLSVVDGVVDIAFSERHALLDGFLVMLDGIEPGRRDPNGKPYVVTVQSATSIRLPMADGRDFGGIDVSASAIVGLFTLPLGAADNEIIGDVEPGGTQRRWALLEMMLEGNRIDTPEVAYLVRDRRGAT